MTRMPRPRASLRSGSISTPANPSVASAAARTRGRVLADAGGERDDVDAAELREVRARVGAEPVDVDVERERGRGIAALDAGA